MRASEGKEGVGLGPIGQAVKSKEYTEIALLSDYPQDKVVVYTKWLGKRTNAKITVTKATLSSPTNFTDIYTAAVAHLQEKCNLYGSDISFTFHLSPGTPAMAAVWIILAKTRFAAQLIESSKVQGVRTVDFPFDLAADFIPELYRHPDKSLELLAAGEVSFASAFSDIVYRSETMRRAVLRANMVAPRSVPVLIEGESGTGKELFARAIHAAGPRRDQPFIAINCGAIPTQLIESEFFGHEKGSFTGASTTRIGHFEAANGGTIFLDEIGEIPKEMQVKLLRTLQENEVRRIGSSKTITIDIRVIAATNRNLIEEVAAGNFREDLFYRLAVAVLKLPPLREREGDLNLLIDTFLAQINQESQQEPGHKGKQISAAARNIMLQHSWPGNIRELQNTLARAAIWSLNEDLSEEDIREALLPIPLSQMSKDTILGRPIGNGLDLPAIMKKVAVHYLERGLRKTNQNKTKTAKLLGLSSYQTLTNWLHKYEVK